MEEILINKFTCSICYEIKPFMGMLGCKCKKYFCGKCFQQMCQENRNEKCPYCAMDTDKKLLIPISDDLELLNYLIKIKEIPKEECINSCGFSSNSPTEFFNHSKSCIRKINCPNGCGLTTEIKWDQTVYNLMYTIHGLDLCKNEIASKCHICEKDTNVIKHIATCPCRLYHFCPKTPKKEIKKHIKYCLEAKQYNCKICIENSTKGASDILTIDDLKLHYRNYHPVDYSVIDYISSKCNKKYKNFIFDVLIKEIDTKQLEILDKYSKLLK
jgi:hypothetical protein